MTISYSRDDFKSPLEFDVYRYLSNKAKVTGSELTYETERLPYILTKNYVPDFIWVFPDGRKMYIEAKGFFRGEDRTKLLAAKANNPGIDLRIVFSKDNKINKKSRTRYSDWATKHGFPCAVGQIPAEWLE